MTPSMSENMEDEIVNILSKNYSKVADLTPKCDRCYKPVYVVEELKLDNKIFHKVCFKCKECDRTLEKNKFNEHNEEFYCQSCYTRYFGPNASSSMLLDSKKYEAAGDNFNNFINSANQENKSYHEVNENRLSNSDQDESFFKIVLKKPTSNFNNVAVNDFTSGYDQKSKWVQDYFKHSAIAVQKKAVEKVVLIHSNNCYSCHKPVYAVEELRVMNNIYHKFCYKCNSCKKLLDTNTSTDHKGVPYCRNCYSKNFGAKVYANDNRPEAIAFRNQIDSSHRVQAIHVQSAKSAFTPYTNAKEESSDSKETIDTNVSTKNLINSYSNLINEKKPLNQVRKQSAPTKTVHYANAQKETISFASRRSFDKENLNNNLSNLKSALKKTQSSSILTEEASSARSDSKSKLNNKFGQVEKCYRCGQSVFAAERLLGGKNVYHSICFKCFSCNKGLNLTNYCEHNNQIICKPCSKGKNSAQINI